MQQALKQSTAATTIVGPILDSTGAVYTGAVIGDLNITKNGTTAAMAAAATLTHDHNGHYVLVLTTGNTDTLGRLDVTCNKSTYAMPPKAFEVLAATAFDALVTNGTIASTTSGRTIVTDAAGLVDANVVKLGPTGAGTAQTARDLGASVLLSSGTGTGQISLSSGAVTVGTNNDKTGYSLTQSFPTNFSSFSIDASGRIDVGKWLGNAVTVDANSVPNVSTKYLGGTLLTARDIGASVLLSTGTGAGQLDFTSGVVKSNAVQWLGGTIPAVNITGVPLVDAKYLLGTVFATPATAGVLDANVKNINNVSASSVTTVNANVGTTQPVNFTGTGASALAKSDMVDIAGAAVSTSTAQIGVNVVNVAGTAQTAGDLMGWLRVDSGVLASPSNLSFKLAASAPAVAGAYDGHLIYSGTQQAIIKNYSVAREFDVDVIGGGSFNPSVGAAYTVSRDVLFYNLPGSVGSIAASGISANSFATNAITAASLAADAGTEIGTAVWANGIRTLTDKTGFSLSGTQAFDNAGTWTGNIDGDITGGVLGDVRGDVQGNVIGSVGSVTASVTVGTIAANAITATSTAADYVAEIAAAVGSTTLASGTVVSTTGTTTTLDTGAVGTANYYNGESLVIVSGTGAGQEVIITAYSSGRVATHAAWVTNPTNTSTYAIRAGKSSATVTGSGDATASNQATIIKLIQAQK